MAGFAKRDGDTELPVINSFHRNVKPVTTQRCFIVIDFIENFFPGYSGMADIGAKLRASLSGLAQ